VSAIDGSSLPARALVVRRAQPRETSAIASRGSRQVERQASSDAIDKLGEGGATLLRCLGHERESDVGGCWQYVERYAKANSRNTLSVCEALLQRTCEAVALILDTADKLSAAESEAAA
jgi:hypothetical protein